MTPLQIRNDRYHDAVRESFERQTMMTTLGARLILLKPGEVHIALNAAPPFAQQNGFMHAGALTAIADSACGYAAFTLAAAETDVLTVEFKINLLAPASAPRFEARARVLRSGQTLTVCAADVFGIDAKGEKVVATMLSTLIIRPLPR